MSYGKIDPVDGDFCLHNSDIKLSSYESTWSKDFNIPMKGKLTYWRLTFLRSIYDKCFVYLTYLSDHRYPQVTMHLIRRTGSGFPQSRNKIIIRGDLHISFGRYFSAPNKKSIKVTTNNIYFKNKRVLIYTLNPTDAEFVRSGSSIEFSTEIRGTIIEIPELQTFPVNIETIPTNVLKNLEAFFMDQKFCDVTFETADARISAHKNILAAQSPVFKCMFSSQMLEKTPGTIINLENTEGVALKEMLRFMYGGRVENIEQIADKLLILANKYEMESLMTLCEKVLYEKLTISNAISTLKIADIHNAKNLRRLTEEFIIKNKSYLFETAEFKSLMSTTPEIVIDILKSE